MASVAALSGETQNTLFVLSASRKRRKERLIVIGNEALTNQHPKTERIKKLSCAAASMRASA